MTSGATTKRSLLGAVGCGGCAAGAVTVAVAAWVLPADRAVDPRATTGLGWLAALVLFMAFVVGLYWWTRESGLARTAWVALAALSFVGVLVRCVFVLTAEHGDGLIGRQPLVALYGAAVGVVGAVLFVLLPDRAAGSARESLRRAVAATATALIVVGLGCAIPAPVAWGVVSHPSNVMRQQAIPASVSRVAWSAAVGDDVSDVVRVTGGVAVLTYTEVVGVDGRSGRRTWSFARPGADLVSIRSNGGSRVLVTWVGGSAAADRPYLTVLDGATGRTLFTRPWDVKASGEGAWDLVSGDTLVVHRAEDRRVEGFSLSTGDRSWTFDAAKGCTVTGEALRTTIGVVVEEQCGGRGQLISLNDDGEVRWRRRATMPARPHASPGPGLPLATNLDGSLVTVRWATEDVPSRYGVLDARTGRRVTGDRAYGQPLLGQVYALDESSDREHGLRNVRTGATVDAGFRNSTCRGVIGSIGIDLRGGIVCLSKSALSSLDGSGGAVVTMQRWGGASRDIPASLGAPVDVGDPGSLEDRTLRDMLAYYAGLGRVPLRVIDAQGAVVVWAPSSDGTKLIGLR